MKTYYFKNGEYEVEIKDINEKLHLYSEDTSYENGIFSSSDLETNGVMIADTTEYTSIMLEVKVVGPEETYNKLANVYLSFDLTSAYDIYDWPNPSNSYENEVYRLDCWPISCD